MSRRPALRAEALAYAGRYCLAWQTLPNGLSHELCLLPAEQREVLGLAERMGSVGAARPRCGSGPATWPPRSNVEPDGHPGYPPRVVPLVCVLHTLMEPGRQMPNAPRVPQSVCAAITTAQRAEGAPDQAGASCSAARFMRRVM